MAGPIALQAHAAHGLARQGPATWQAEDHDPQFIIPGPFAPGLWELRISGGALDAPAYASAQLYFARAGDFSEAQSIRFPFHGPAREHRVRFFLPFEAASLRFDPSDAPGLIDVQGITAVRRGKAAGTLEGIWRTINAGAGSGIRHVTAQLRRAAASPGTAKRVLLDLALAREPDPYEGWLQARIRERSTEYPVKAEHGLLSLLTTVYDTAPAYLDALARSLERQTFGDYEWILLDNGSRNPATRSAIERIGRDPRVRLHHVPENLGIIGGMRFVLERATGRYVLPVDSDDELTPDGLALVASTIQRSNYPPLLYSDEDKLRDGARTDPFLKPDWDPVLLRNLCYIAHLCAIDRQIGLELGIYSDRRCEGCHDWDTFLRFVRAGHQAVHVPDVIYAWRMHAQSTAADAFAKDYIVSSQRNVLERHVNETGHGERLEVVQSPFFPASPDWWLRRRRTAAPLPAVLLLRAGSQEDVAAIQAGSGGFPFASVRVATSIDALVSTAAQAAEPLALIADADATPRGDEWAWELSALAEAFDDAAVFGGRLLDVAGRVISAGEIFGFDGGVGSPDRGRSAQDAGYFGTALKQRSVDAVAGYLCAVRPELLRSSAAPRPATAAALGPWLGLQAALQQKRVIFSPYVEAVLKPGAARPAGPEGIDLPRESRFYHRLLDRRPSGAYRPLMRGTSPAS